MIGRSFKRYLEKRDEVFWNEARRRDEEFQSEARRRDEDFQNESRRRDEEFREFNREILLRNEKVYTSVIAEMEEGRKQIRANTEAVLSMLDRLNGSSS